jgi:hypothetical protein
LPKKFRFGCSIEDCDREHHAQGYCQLHHKRWWSHGDPLSTINASPLMGMRERFERIGWDVMKSGCWEWRGGKGEKGYGQFRAPGRSWIAPRAAHELYIGPIPEGMLVRHTCDNPPCVNPDHLVVGTHIDNNNDKVERGRQTKGAAVNTNKLTESQVLEMRRLRLGGAKSKDLAIKFGVSTATASAICTGRTWKWLLPNQEPAAA